MDDDLDSEVERDPSDHEDNINWSDQGKNIEAFQRVRREHGRDDDVRKAREGADRIGRSPVWCHQVRSHRQLYEPQELFI